MPINNTLSRNALLKKLMKSYRVGNRADFIQAAEDIIKEEEKRNNTIFANDLRKELYGSESFRDNINNIKIPTDKERGLPLFEIMNFQLSWADIILDDYDKYKIEKILIENSKKYILKSYSINPSQKLLFFGPPGCGKTLCAKIISSLLLYPMIYIRFDTVISSYLGETSANLRKIFNFIEDGEWVVLFDEFDIIGKYRENSQEHGEMQRLVNNLLQMIDNYNGDSIIIAATNHEQLLDSALWRRFDEVVYFGYPTEKEIINLFNKNLKSIKTSDINYDSLAKDTLGMSYADIERICLETIKRVILTDKNIIDNNDLEISILEYKGRLSQIKEKIEARNGRNH